jgi:hypothetical protein
MAANDLTTMDEVCNWLATPNPPPGVAATILPELITNTSEDFLRELGRPDFFPAADYTEVREGDGDVRMTMRHWPINSVASVTVSGTGLAPSPDKIQDGYYIDDDLDPELRDQLWVNGGLTDAAPVVVVYNAGYAEAPGDVAQAVVEWIADRYTNRTGSGKGSQRAAGGEHVTYEHGEDSIPPQVMRVIAKYKRAVPSLDKRQDDRDYLVTRINRTITEKVS